MKSIVILFSFLVVNILGGVNGLAFYPQGEGENKSKQDAAQQRVEYDALQVISKEQNATKKYESAQGFLTKYPSSTYLSYAKKELNFARYVLAFEYRGLGKYDDEFRVAGEFLKESPDNKAANLQDLALLVTLANDSGLIGKHLDEGAQYAKQAIDQINSGKKIDDPQKPWDSVKTQYLSQMNRTIGVANSNNHKLDEAIIAFNKAIEIDCSDPYNYYFLAIAHQQRYEDAAKKFNNQLSKTSPEAKAALDEAYAQADKAIESFAKTIITGQVHPQAATYEKLSVACKSNLEPLYKLRHENKLDGFDPYLEGLKASTCKK